MKFVVLAFVWCGIRKYACARGDERRERARAIKNKGCKKRRGEGVGARAAPRGGAALARDDQKNKGFAEHGPSFKQRTAKKTEETRDRGRKRETANTNTGGAFFLRGPGAVQEGFACVGEAEYRFGKGPAAAVIMPPPPSNTLRRRPGSGRVTKTEALCRGRLAFSGPRPGGEALGNRSKHPPPFCQVRIRNKEAKPLEGRAPAHTRCTRDATGKERAEKAGAKASGAETNACVCVCVWRRDTESAAPQDCGPKGGFAWVLCMCVCQCPRQRVFQCAIVCGVCCGVVLCLLRRNIFRCQHGWLPPPRVLFLLALRQYEGRKGMGKKAKRASKSIRWGGPARAVLFCLQAPRKEQTGRGRGAQLGQYFLRLFFLCGRGGQVALPPRLRCVPETRTALANADGRDEGANKATGAICVGERGWCSCVCVMGR
jgi:hypothetical protein